MILIVLAAILVVLQIVDGVTTYIALGNGDSEANPRAVWLFNKFGVLPTIVVSKLFISVVVVLLALTGSVIGYFVLLPLIVLYAYVAINNLDVVLG